MLHIPAQQAKEIVKNGRGKQFSVYRECIYDDKAKKKVLVYRLMRDCGNVAYKDFLEQVAVPDPNERNEIFAHTRMSAEKAGDVIEFWLGVLDVALSPEVWVSRTTSTINDKRRGSFDCTLQHDEAADVLDLLNDIPDYHSLPNFTCLSEYEKAHVLEVFRKKIGFVVDDANMGEAETEPGVGSPTQPGEAEADPEQDDDASKAAEESALTARQKLLDSLGQLYNVSEMATVCPYCGSTEHDHIGCEHPNKASVSQTLKGIRKVLEEGQSPTDDAEMEQEDETTEQPEGTTTKDEPTGSPMEEEPEPAQARTAKYFWYNAIMGLTEVGDLDESGRFCISGRDVSKEGPMSRDALYDVIREAVVRGVGDIWKAQDFMNAYADTNIPKSMYQRVSVPSDGFLQIVPNTGCHFHAYEFYPGVEFSKDYRFGEHNKLEPYEEEVSNALNRCLRHNAGKVMLNPRLGLKCDDAGWINIDDVLKYENIWRQEKTRYPHTFLAPVHQVGDKWRWNRGEVQYRFQTLFRIMFHSARYMDIVSENKSSPSAFTLMWTGMGKLSDQVVSTQMLKSLKKDSSSILWPFGLPESHGIRPFRMNHPDDDEETAVNKELDEQIRKAKEETFKATVDEAQDQQASASETQSQFDFNPDEVDYTGDDEEMEEEVDVEVEEEKEEEIDEEQEQADEEARQESDKLPAWTRNLDPSVKQMPTEGLLNVDMSDGAAQIFGNSMIIKILQMFTFYHRQRVLMSPKEYYDAMIKNDIGRLDLDGICPYDGEDDEGNLKYPSDIVIKEWFDQKAKKVPWSDELMFAGRPWDYTKPVINLLIDMEKMMQFLVEAVFTPDRLQFLIPMSRMKGTNEEKSQMRDVVSNFLSRVLQGAFTEKKHYATTLTFEIMIKDSRT
eukprot:s3561_g10.t1